MLNCIESSICWAQSYLALCTCLPSWQLAYAVCTLKSHTILCKICSSGLILTCSFCRIKLELHELVETAVQGLLNSIYTRTNLGHYTEMLSGRLVKGMCGGIKAKRTQCGVIGLAIAYVGGCSWITLDNACRRRNFNFGGRIRYANASAVCQGGLANALQSSTGSFIR